MTTGLGKRLAAALTALSLGGCASLQSVSLGDVPSDRSRPIVATKSSWSVLGVYFSNDFVDDVVEDLRGQCPKGGIAGVFTKHEGYTYFIITERSVTARGYCVEDRARQAAPPAAP